MQIGWIDFSKGDRDKVLSVLQLFAEQVAVDELGIGSVRDAFANFFFPGTSTIQTRAKYFFIVSYLLQETAAARNGLDWLGAQEYDCCRRLVNSAKQRGESLVGIIGNTQVDTKTWVKRKPSDIYWNGIKTLGFFNRLYADLSMSEYLRQAELIAKEKDNLNKSSRRNRDEDEDADDDVTLGAAFRKFWEVKPEAGWRDNLRIDLTATESAFFTDTLQQHYPQSVFNILMKHWPDADLSFPAVADLVKEYVDDDTRILLEYALKFDRLVYSACVAYNVILSDGANDTATSEWAAIRPQLQEIADIDLADIFMRLGLNKPATLRFLRKLVQLYSENAEFEHIKKLLIGREIDLKGRNRAKLLHPSAENQNWIGGGHLDYRTANVCQIIKDVKHYV